MIKPFDPDFLDAGRRFPHGIQPAHKRPIRTPGGQKHRTFSDAECLVTVTTLDGAVVDAAARRNAFFFGAPTPKFVQGQKWGETGWVGDGLLNEMINI